MQYMSKSQHNGHKQYSSDHIHRLKNKKKNKKEMHKFVRARTSYSRVYPESSES